MNIEIYMLIFYNIVFLFSEILPFIKTIKSNGIVELIFNNILIALKHFKKQQLQDQNETTFLINSDLANIKHNDYNTLRDLMKRLLNELDKLDNSDAADASDSIYVDANAKSMYISSLNGQTIEIN